MTYFKSKLSQILILSKYSLSWPSNYALKAFFYCHYCQQRRDVEYQQWARIRIRRARIRVVAVVLCIAAQYSSVYRVCIHARFLTRAWGLFYLIYWHKRAIKRQLLCINIKHKFFFIKLNNQFSLYTARTLTWQKMSEPDWLHATKFPPAGL